MFSGRGQCPCNIILAEIEPHKERLTKRRVNIRHLFMTNMTLNKLLCLCLPVSAAFTNKALFAKVCQFNLKGDNAPVLCLKPSHLKLYYTVYSQWFKTCFH